MLCLSGKGQVSLRISTNIQLLTQYLRSGHINVPFLNFMALLAERSGEVVIRVGGNTQDYATLVDQTPNGGILGKENVDTGNPVRKELLDLGTCNSPPDRQTLRHLSTPKTCCT